MQVRVKLRGARGMEMGSNECDSKWRTVVLSTWGLKWQLMEDVKEMWYTE